MNMTTGFSRRFITASVCLMLLAACCLLGGCGENEQEQRTAFMGLLEKNVMGKSGMRYTPLSDEQKKQLGSAYTEQYELLGSLHQDKELEEKFSAFQSAMMRGLTSSGTPEEKLGVIKQARASMDEAKALISGRLDDRTNKRNAFSQPEDLKALYDKAFAKVIGTPLTTMIEVFDLTSEALDAAAALNQYIVDNPGAADFSGGMLKIKEAKHEAKLKELLNDMNKKANAAQESARKLVSLVR